MSKTAHTDRIIALAADKLLATHGHHCSPAVHAALTNLTEIAHAPHPQIR